MKENPTILVAGDFCPRDRVLQHIMAGDISVLDSVHEVTASVDYAIVNLECPIVNGNAKPIVKSGPNLRADETALDVLKDAGFNGVTLANNHFYDYGDVGVQTTLSALQMRQMDYVGGGLNRQDAARLLYKEIAGIKLAIVNCCEQECSIASDAYGGANPLNPIQQYYAIKEAKRNAKYVLVIVHGGSEHYQLPTPRMQETYRFFVDAGADAVINHHQHCYSGLEVYQEKPIFYGLGNFCFDRPDRKNSIWNEGYMVKLELRDGKVDYTLLPYIQCNEEPIVKWRKDRGEFDRKMSELNAIIADPNQLQAEFDKLVAQNKLLYQYYVEPYNSRIAKWLYKHHLLPSFMKRKYVVLANVIRCEAHRDRLLQTLKS